ncbi:MAG: carbohydrate binding family 9 domain-containing protein [Candidatus Hydrogenedentes bacterium]|nr:carbohydrate binding family 9 domain-containing protein [Candidatus Hydrogenedentota bacterium]
MREHLYYRDGLRVSAKRPASKYLILFPLIALAFTSSMGWADNGDRLATVGAVRTETPPVIDGRLDEPCWAQAEVTSGFIDRKTDRPAKEQTLVRVLYDNENLYIGFECEELEPENILATERKDDRFLDADDTVEILIDSFHDHRNLYVFITNTLGTRLDARDGIYGFSSAWDCNWKVACTIGEDRWFAELAIPVGELLFERSPLAVWGINFRRVEKGAQEVSSWSYRRESRARYSARDAGELTGLDLSKAKVERRPRFETYVSATGQRGRDGEVSTGADISLRLTPNMVSTFTINPDFGQIEADADTIELRDTERFLPEHRPFFREGTEVFETPIDVYYSRRFVDIDSGAKVTGGTRNWSFGLLGIDGVVSQSGQHRPGKFTVGRYVRNVADESQVGVIAMHSDRDDGTVNRVTGVDTQFYLTDRLAWTAQALNLSNQEWVTKVDRYGYEYEDLEKYKGHALSTNIRYGAKHLRLELGYLDISEEFRPDLGFIRRRDVRGPELEYEYNRELVDGPVKEYAVEGEFTQYENHDGETTLRDFEEWVGVTFRNEWGFWLGRTDDFHRPYHNRSTSLSVIYNEIDEWHSVSGMFTHGVFEEVPYDELTLEKPLKLSERLTASFSGAFRREEQPAELADIWLWRLVTEYTFPWDGRVKLTAEESSENRHNVTLLFSWPVREDLDFHLVLTHVQAEGETEEERGAFTKVVYRF